jgi:hypothetical protein
MYGEARNGDCAKLLLKSNLGSDPDADETASALFHGGLLSSIALKGADHGVYITAREISDFNVCLEIFFRASHRATEGLEGVLAELKDR